LVLGLSTLIRCASVLLLVLVATVASAQTYRGEAIPVTQRVDPVEILQLRFLTFAFGREGPMDTPLATPPVAGNEYFFEADVFGIESATTIRFELLDITGRSLQTVAVWKDSDASDNGEFHGVVKVPGGPFRFAVIGTSRTGTAFRAVSTVFQPSTAGVVEKPILPPGLSAAQSSQLQQLVTAYQQELRTHAAHAAAEHPDGVITLARAVVSRITYEPLNSKSGLPIGLRLHYSIRFPVRQTIAAMPHVFPVYQNTAWRGFVAMKVSGGAITPTPQLVGPQSLQDVIVYGAATTYQAGTTYDFIVDMVPDYVIQGSQTGRFCLYEQKFSNRAVWDALIASTVDVPYSISISDTEIAATIPTFFSQRTFQKNFTADGAFDCGSVPNSRF
jgi:hypothetical protein